MGSCNGLLCFSAKDWVYLLNPSIGKLKMVSLLSSSSSAGFSLVETGFCYHSETNDYKIVKISYRNWSLNIGGTPPQAEIYSMNSGSWKRLHPHFAPIFSSLISILICSSFHFSVELCIGWSM